MPIPTYAEFLQGAEETDVRLMNFFAMGQRISTQDPVEADQFYAALERLFGYEVLTRAVRGWERRNDGVWYTFDAVIDPVAATYVARAAMERLIFSRDEALPTPP